MDTTSIQESAEAPEDSQLWLWDDTHDEWVRWVAEQWADTLPSVTRPGDEQ